MNAIGKRLVADRVPMNRDDILIHSLQEVGGALYDLALQEARRQMADGNPGLAAASYRRARSILAGHRHPEIMVQNAVAEAWAGNLVTAEYMLKTALRSAQAQNVHEVASYHLGSVLAAQGRFREANEIFGRHTQPLEWALGATMRSIRIPDVHFGWHLKVPVPIDRKVTHAPNGRGEEADFIYFAACDSRYLKLFGEALFNSIAQHVSGRPLLHLHVINPDEEAEALLGRLQDRGSLLVTVSSELAAIHERPIAQQRVYYACARFLLVCDLLRQYRRPIIITDIDQMVVADISSLFREQSLSDIRLLQFDHGVFNIMSKFSASIIIAEPTKSAETFFERVSAYVAERMSDPLGFGWHLDQIALAVSHLVSDDVRFEFLPTGTMHSGTPGAEIPQDTMFWSITYSIKENAKKLSRPEFRSLLAQM